MSTNELTTPAKAGSPRLTPDEVNSLTDLLDGCEVINDRLTAYAAGLPHAENPAELSQRELHAYLIASSAMLRALSDNVERLGEAAK